MQLLDARGITTSPAASVSTAEPVAVLAPEQQAALAVETSDATWEEMDAFIRKKTQLRSNGLVLMAVAGVLAAIGLATNALHLVIAAMVIAPGFEPLVQIALGPIARTGRWWSGVVGSLEACGMIVAAAAVTGIVLRALGVDPLGSKSAYLATPGVLVTYWTRLDATAVIVVAAAGIAGALLVAIGRETLTAGVMIALALIPSATLAGLGLVTGRLDVVWAGLGRLAIEAVLVVAASLVVLGWKRLRVQRRPMAL
jgi:uncharacterized membrane protein